MKIIQNIQTPFNDHFPDYPRLAGFLLDFQSKQGVLSKRKFYRLFLRANKHNQSIGTKGGHKTILKKQ